MHKCLVLLALVSLCACQTVASAGPSGTLVPAAPLEPIVEATITPEPSATPSAIATTPAPDASEEAAWAGGPHGSAAAPVPCTDCHQVAGGVIDGSRIAWWDAPSQQYQPVADVNSLCQKCHQQLKPASDAGASNNAIHTGFQCTACHNQHTTAASCTNSSCHADILQTSDMPPSTPVGGHPQVGNPFCGGRNCHPAATAAAAQPRSVHGAAHMNVTCQACHAAGDLTPGPGKDGGPWVIWQVANGGASATAKQYFPHAIQLQVDCQRCHFANNSWGLPLVTGNEFQH